MANKLYLLLFVLFFSSYFHSVIEEDPLPALGDYSSASISLSGEYELGRLWLAMYRGSTKEHSDPLMRTYLEDLIYRDKLNLQDKFSLKDLNALSWNLYTLLTKAFPVHIRLIRILKQRNSHPMLEEGLLLLPNGNKKKKTIQIIINIIYLPFRKYN